MDDLTNMSVEEMIAMLTELGLEHGQDRDRLAAIRVEFDKLTLRQAERRKMFNAMGEELKRRKTR